VIENPTRLQNRGSMAIAREERTELLARKRKRRDRRYRCQFRSAAEVVLRNPVPQPLSES
jgi:hypothetical protein